MELILQLAIIIAFGVILGIVALKLKVPLIIGYIIGGAIMGIFVHFNHEQLETINSLAEVGVALLLFSIGIEFSLEKLLNVKKFALVGGVLQIILNILLGVLIFPLLGFEPYESLFLGAVFALSSTAVVIKILDDIGQIETPASQITIGWLILQDIAVVILIIILGNLSSGSLNTAALFESLLKSSLLIAVALVIGNKVIPRILTSMSILGSKELMVVASFGFCLLFALAAQELVGSFTLGAFLAGLMISESFLHHEIFSEIRPLQNIFSLFFFIIIGTLFSFDYLFGNLLTIFLTLVIIIVSKFIIIMALNVLLKMHIRNATEVGLNLAQVGEFAFLSARIGLNSGWIDQDLSSLIVVVTILSMVITPFIITHIDSIYERIREYTRLHSPNMYRKFFMAPQNDIEIETKIKNHIIICGFGRVGKYIALALKKLRYKVMVIELDTKLVEEAKALGIHTLYGDATSEEILLNAQIENTKAVIIALPKESQVINIANKIRSINPDVEIIIRRHHFQIKEDTNLKAFKIIEPEFEAALKIVEKVLHTLGKKDRKILGWLRDQKSFLN